MRIKDAIVKILEDGVRRNTKILTRDLDNSGYLGLGSNVMRSTVSAAVYGLSRDGKIQKHEKFGKGKNMYSKLGSFQPITDTFDVPTPSRSQVQAQVRQNFTSKDKFRESMFGVVRDALNAEFRTVSFHVDHAQTMHEHNEDAHHPDNFQIITQRDNNCKGSNSTKRMTFDQQKEYLENFSYAEAASISRDEPLDEPFVDLLIETLKSVYDV